MTVLQAKARLIQSETNPATENKKKQIDLLRNSLPSAQNRRSMSQIQRLNTRKQILNLENQIVNDRLKDESKKGQKKASS